MSINVKIVKKENPEIITPKLNTKNRPVSLLVIVGLIVVLILLFGPFLKKSKKITFAQCQASGGSAWTVDLYHPDICPACVEYQKCSDEQANLLDVNQKCPTANKCFSCLEKNFPYPDKCPDSMSKIGEISDSSIWHMCCR